MSIKTIIIKSKTMIMRTASAVLLLSVVLSVSSCGNSDTSLEERERYIQELYGTVELSGGEEENEVNATTSNFTLAYSRSEKINPYTCASMLNATLCDLIYDKLIIVNSEFEAEEVIALKVEVGTPKQINVTLRDGIVFSDGTPLTGKDIKYSFDKARSSGSRFYGQLKNFSNCSYSNNQVQFRLYNDDPRAYMLLDFPIIKANSDSNGAVPTGSGRYTYINDVVKGTFLLKNKKWYSTNTSNVERISLSPMPTVESIVHSVEIGTISYYYTDLRDGYPSRINANYSTVNINNLVYIGVNTTKTSLMEYEVRDAINKALNREEIISTAFAGRAYAATGPLTTSWPTAANAQRGATLPELPAATKLLDDAGFINQDENYIRNNGSGVSLKYDLLVNSDNSFHLAVAERVAEQLKQVGISVSIREIGKADYKQRIAQGGYDLYIGEYALYNNMDFSEIFTPNKGLYYGLNPQNTVDSWKSYCAGTGTIEEVIEQFESELPFIPVCYRLGMVCYSRSLAANMDVTESDLFLHMELWDVALAE